MSIKISFITVALILFASCKNVEKVFDSYKKNKLENPDNSINDYSDDQTEDELDNVQERLNKIDTNMEVSPPNEDKNVANEDPNQLEGEGSDEDEVALRVGTELKELADKANGLAEKLDFRKKSK